MTGSDLMAARRRRLGDSICLSLTTVAGFRGEWAAGLGMDVVAEMVSGACQPRRSGGANAWSPRSFIRWDRLA